MKKLHYFFRQFQKIISPILAKKSLRFGIIFLVILTSLFALNWTANKIVGQEVKNPKYGVTFIKNYAEDFGLNWKKTMLALLDDLEIKHYRLVSYWNNHEKVPDAYDFTDLDWQMDQVAKRGGTVDLAIGLRQPRWPECHEPQWATDLPYDEWKQELLDYITVVVERYKDHPALARYQLENEAMNGWVGECDSTRERLIEEFNLVKKLDPHHPVAMSLSDQHGFPANQPTPDAYGFSIYRIVYNQLFPGPTYYITYPTPIWYHHLRAAMIHLIKDRPTFIHELQMEPWGPRPIIDMSIEEQSRSMSEEQVHTNFDFGRRIGMEEIYLWGGEWWYWRKEKLNDPSIWEAVREELSHGKN